MTTVGFIFTKISGEKNVVSDQNIRIENNIGITNVEVANVIDAKRTIVKFSFAFTCKYEPAVGTIDILGEILEMYDQELATQIVDSWTKDKKLHPDIMSRILNNVMAKSNIEAILLSRELQLPPPVQLPKVEVKPRSAVERAEMPKQEQKKEEAKEEKKEAKKEEKKKR